MSLFAVAEWARDAHDKWLITARAQRYVCLGHRGKSGWMWHLGGGFEKENGWCYV